MSGGVLNINAANNNALYVGQLGTATWNLSGGTANLNQLGFAASSGTSSGTLNFTGGLINIGSTGITQGSGLATLNMGGGTLGSLASWITPQSDPPQTATSRMLR